MSALNPFKSRNTKQYQIADLFLQGFNRETIFRMLYPKMMEQTYPWIFTNNVDGRRVPIQPVADQTALLFYRIGAVREELLNRDSSLVSILANETVNYEDKQRRIALYNSVRRDYENGVSTVTVPVVADPEPEPVSNGSDYRDKLTYLQRRCYEIRAYVQSKKSGNREFDFVSTRAFVHGRDALIQGIEPDDFLWSIGASWPEENRIAAGLNTPVNYRRYAIPGTPLVMGYVILLLKAGIPAYLVGPTGSGKSVLARMISEYLEKEYGEIPLSLGVSRSDLLGAHTPAGYISRPLVNMYREGSGGGVFCMEEIDACDPNVLLTVNNAIANSSLFNTVTGEEIKRDASFMPLATANTFGTGATSNYGAREGLDGSTLDRFKYGRVWVDYDSEIESSILFGNVDEDEESYLANVAATAL